MQLHPQEILPATGPRGQVISAQQIGVSVNGTLAVAIAAAGAGTGEFQSNKRALAKGKIVRIYASNLTAALTGNATHSVIPARFNPGNGVALGATTLIPLLISPGLSLTSADLIGIVKEITALGETEEVQLLQAPGGANQVKLAAADARPDGFWCDGSIEIISGLGVGQKNRLTSFANGTKIALVKNIEGTSNWKVATDATSLARIRTRRYIVNKDDLFRFVLTYAVGTGGTGTDAEVGLEIEFDDSVV